MNLKELFTSNLKNAKKVLEILEISYIDNFNTLVISLDLDKIKLYNFIKNNELIDYIDIEEDRYSYSCYVFFIEKETKLKINFYKDDLKVLKFNSFFMDIAKLTANQSYCNKLKVGAVLVHNNNIISTGYNGTISGFPNICEINNDTLPEVCHAEFNAIIQCIKNGILIPDNCIMYCTHFPCFECAKLIVSTNKIKQIVYINDYKNNESIKILKDIKLTKWI